MQVTKVNVPVSRRRSFNSAFAWWRKQQPLASSVMTTLIWFVWIEVVTFDKSKHVVNKLSKVSNGNFNGRWKNSYEAFSLKDRNFNSSYSLSIECPNVIQQWNQVTLAKTVIFTKWTTDNFKLSFKSFIQYDCSLWRSQFNWLVRWKIMTLRCDDAILAL